MLDGAELVWAMGGAADRKHREKEHREGFAAALVERA